MEDKQITSIINSTTELVYRRITARAIYVEKEDIRQDLFHILYKCVDRYNPHPEDFISFSVFFYSNIKYVIIDSYGQLTCFNGTKYDKSIVPTIRPTNMEEQYVDLLDKSMSCKTEEVLSNIICNKVLAEIENLTYKNREILKGVIAGIPQKDIGAIVGISQCNVSKRLNCMRKFIKNGTTDTVIMEDITVLTNIKRLLK